MEAKTRVLGAIRQSKTRDKAVSPAAQRKAIKGWADANSATVAKVTEDLSTSGALSVFKRKDIGPWLNDPEKIAAWDVFVATKLDRACRDTSDYFRLREWCKDHRKRLVFLSNPELDESTPGGKALAGILAVFAEFERDMIRERNRERYAAMTDAGKWPGGRLPFGWRYDADSGELEADTNGTADILGEMVSMAIAGKSNGQIQRWLNDSGHLNGNGSRWYVERVRLVLHADTTTELIGEARAAELRAALRKREQTHGERVGGHLLLRVAFCRQCQGPLYALVQKSRPDAGRYRCLHCGIYLSKTELDTKTENILLNLYGDNELTELRLVPGDDHQAAIHALERDVGTLEKITGTESLIESKKAEIEALRAEPFEADHYVPEPLGISVADHWASLDENGRGAFLRRYHVRVFADKHSFEFRGGLLAESEVAEGYMEPLEPEL